MNRGLLWKLCLISALGVVAFFYVINMLTAQTEDGMSFIADQYRYELREWSKEAEELYFSEGQAGLDSWLSALRAQEQTWLAVAKFEVAHVAGDPLILPFRDEYTLGRSVDWKIHLYFEENPVMELPFAQGNASFLIQLPDRMRPGENLGYTQFVVQIILPMVMMGLLCILLYQNIMSPLKKLQRATQEFSRGNFDVRVKELLGNRNDELSELANTFDNMASRVGELIISQRQLIADLSHELRTPLTRLDIAVANVKQDENPAKSIQRINKEALHIRKLVEDTLTLAWLENEQPQLQQESVNLVDLVDILVEDAKYEFPDHLIQVVLTDSPFPDKNQEPFVIANSSHRALGQALENIIRNALRYTPKGKTVTIEIETLSAGYQVDVSDQGPGVEEQYLTSIFKPFFRIDKSRAADANSFGLGLALAQRQLAAIKANIHAYNLSKGGLCMSICIPKH